MLFVCAIATIVERRPPLSSLLALTCCGPNAVSDDNEDDDNDDDDSRKCYNKSLMHHHGVSLSLDLSRLIWSYLSISLIVIVAQSVGCWVHSTTDCLKFNVQHSASQWIANRWIKFRSHTHTHHQTEFNCVSTYTPFSSYIALLIDHPLF